MNDADIQPFVESYVVANTPEYLLAKIWGNPAFDALMKRVTPLELWETIERADRPTGAPSEVLQGYVALVGLLRLAEEDSSIRQRLEAWSPVRLRWGPAMLVDWDSIRRPTSVERRTFASAASEKDSQRSSAANSEIRVVIPS